MGSITVRPAGPLTGTVTVGGAKNSVLKLMAASILAEGTYELTNVPGIVDVELMRELLDAVGVRSSARPAPAPDAAARRARRPWSRWRRPTWSGGCGPRRRCSVRCWPAAAAPGSPCRAATTSGPGRSTCTWPAWRRSGRGSPSTTTTSTPSPTTGCGAPTSRWSSRASVRPRTSSWPPPWPRGPRRSTTRRGSPRSSTCAASWSAWARRSRASARRSSPCTACPRATSTAPSHRVVADRVEAATYLAAVGLAGGEITVRDARAEHMEVVLRKLRAMGLSVESVPGGLRAAGHRTASARPTWPRCPTRAWRPTTSRSSPRCSPSPTGWAS